jgi:mRNA-degrading endonuclease RelE of RelBE toxin-antitoxin system
VTSRTTERFRKALRQLPRHVQEQAKEAYHQFSLDPQHPSLQFKQVHPSRPIFSARVSLGYRALAVRDNDVLIWFWIGSHSDYDRLIHQR